MRRKILMVLAALMCIAPASPASATTVLACTGVWSWSFNPPLTTVHTQTFGTVFVQSVFPDNSCAIASSPCPGQMACTSTPIGWYGAFTASYAGNCLSATVFNNPPILIVGGAAAIAISANVQVAGVLANLCAVNPAVGPAMFTNVVL